MEGRKKEGRKEKGRKDLGQEGENRGISRKKEVKFGTIRADKKKIEFITKYKFSILSINSSIITS